MSVTTDHVWSLQINLLSDIAVIYPSIMKLVRLLANITIETAPAVHLFHVVIYIAHRIIMNFSGVITNARSDVHAKGEGQRSNVKVTEAMTPLSRFRTVTPVWIHIWWWNDTQSWMLLRRAALLFSRSFVTFQGHTAKKNVDFDPNWAFPDCNSSLNLPMDMKQCTKLEAP